MDSIQQKLLCDLQRFSKLSDFTEISHYLRLCESSPSNVNAVIEFLCDCLLDPKFTELIKICFEDVLLIIVTKAIPLNNSNTYPKQHQQKCIALSKIVDSSSSISKFAMKYFINAPSPFEKCELPTIKIQKFNNNIISDLEIIKCCYRFLKNDPSYYKIAWQWSIFFQIYYQTDGKKSTEMVYCNKIIAIVINMADIFVKKINENIPTDILIQTEIDINNEMKLCPIEERNHKEINNLDNNWSLDSDNVLNVEGVTLPIFDKNNRKSFHDQLRINKCDGIVRVHSTKTNLISLALGISIGRAICLAGTVGCGKTTLVEYLAKETGRIAPKTISHLIKELKPESELNSPTLKSGNKRKLNSNSPSKRKEEDPKKNAIRNGFLRIQLGDQTDSKMLLGQYRCTDVPGEFIWQPGVLTQAVMHGYWLLLEDLDSATQDVITVLANLLEKNYLSVPGFRDYLQISPGFQLFITLRNKKITQQHTAVQLLDKHLYTINMLSLNRQELCEIISENYPKLATISSRIVDIFLEFSNGEHSSIDFSMQIDDIMTIQSETPPPSVPDQEAVTTIEKSNSNRLVSTRDLLKLCRRSHPSFSITSAECAYFVFENAVDLFCSHLSYGPKKRKLITNIGAKLGIIQSRCEYLCDKHKPDVNVTDKEISIGRTKLKRYPVNRHQRSQSSSKKIKTDTDTYVNIYQKMIEKAPTFSFTRLANGILERIAICVAQNEPVLLVGETGVGKTSSVQYLAYQTNHKLTVINMNNQSDVSDLVGGFKPVDLTYVLSPLRTEFELLLADTFKANNEVFLKNLSIQFKRCNYEAVVKTMLTLSERGCSRVPITSQNYQRWQILKMKLQKLSTQLKYSINISFAFIPGSLVKCIETGGWILLDEINLASTETLECLSTILEPDGSIVLLERGDYVPIQRHSDFRIFACMNPNTDIGKKDLPIGIRNRFSEFFVDELTDTADLTILITDYLSSTGIKNAKILQIVQLYKKLRAMATLDLNDGLGNRPVYSLRTLCRALQICAKNLCGSIERNLYESFCLSFLTQLDAYSHNIVLTLIRSTLLSNAKSILSQSIPCPSIGQHINFEGYWIQQGDKELMECESYILTDTVRQNLKDLARIISIGKLPVLLQGPTSAGKTSLIEYVAQKSGNHCMRINNHEHTDLQEYIGTYTADVSGKLSFKEGVLVQAMRNGHWIILDELNLAPSDILEALNRVLDDNRELFIAETQKLVKAHPNFMLFATQNPPGLYGGRKTLSRAFKNRFIELHFGEIPQSELEIILEQRCLIPKSHAKKMVKTMAELQMNRNRSTATARSAFTLRDLFRWGNRYTFVNNNLPLTYDWNQHLVEEGYLVLTSKIRHASDVDIIADALFKHFRKRIDESKLFGELNAETSMVTKHVLENLAKRSVDTKIVWTDNMRRMAVLAAKAIDFQEPVLLVGPTGCGKTTICQILAGVSGTNLRILNCHMHTEGADFLGGLRPYRSDNDEHTAEIVEAKGECKQLFEWSNGPLVIAMLEGTYFLADEISLAEDSVLERLNCILEPERTVVLAEKSDINSKQFIIKADKNFQFFATMNPGGDFGKKELSPALRNRFTEIWCRSTESSEDLIRIAEHTLSIGFLECDTIEDKQIINQIATIIINSVFYLQKTIEKFHFSVRDILAWIEYVVKNSNIKMSKKKLLSIAEALCFGFETTFLDALEMYATDSYVDIDKRRAVALKYLNREICEKLDENFDVEEIKNKCGTYLPNTLDDRFGIAPFYVPMLQIQKSIDNDYKFTAPTTHQNLFRLLSAMTLQKAILLEGPPGVGKTSLIESVTRAIGYNLVRINLCEHTDLTDLFGSDLPAENTNNDDNSCDDDQSKKIAAGSFVWNDGPLLAALKAENTWILLDELNLAPQSVLEGLNAILDHRGAAYIPELNKTFVLKQQTRIFASQNPLRQGGGRKGLPQSFLNRFTKVYLRKLNTDDLLHVVNAKYGWYFTKLQNYFYDNDYVFENETTSFFDTISKNSSFDLDRKLVKFSEKLDTAISELKFGYKGGPFEVNLRDILRWCDFVSNAKTGFKITKSHDNILDLNAKYSNFMLILYEKMKLVYAERMRTDLDRKFIEEIFAETFCGCNVEQLEKLSTDICFYWTDSNIYMADLCIKTKIFDPEMNDSVVTSYNKNMPLILLQSQREKLKYLAECTIQAKPVILCGPTDSGKTKTVDTLCTVLDNFCNVDTIDDSVTGSFQQIDLNRHLDKIVESVEKIVLVHLNRLVMDSKKIDLFCSLLAVWERYTSLLKNKHESSDEITLPKTSSTELDEFKCRLLAIDRVLEHLQEKENILSIQLEQIINRLRILKSMIHQTETLNTGGHFEWVDSKIVTALKCGEIICLEHVNLCSSAILDRLNSVFEPNGTLLIAEKGVTDSGKSEEVAKHFNFRVYLTLDPKNGEISRAMRNRCIELSFNKESYTIDDLRQLIFNAGIKQTYVINCLLRIHERLQNVSEFSIFGVSHVIKTAFLTASYQKIGYNDVNAIFISALEVYVRSSTIDLLGYGLSFYRNKLRNEISNELQCLQRFENTCNLDNIILKPNQLNSLSLIQLQCEPFLTICRGLVYHNENVDNQSTSTTILNFDGVHNLFHKFHDYKFENSENFVQYLLYYLYETSTYNDVVSRKIYIDEMLGKIVTNNESKQQFIKKLCELNDIYFKMVNHSNSVKLLSNNDLPWNTKLYPRLRDYNLDANLPLTEQLKLSARLICKFIIDRIVVKKKIVLSEIDVITYSAAIKIKKITDKFNNDLLKHLYSFLFNLPLYIEFALRTATTDMNYEDYVNLICAFLWSNRIYKISQQPLTNENVDRIIDNVMLHFKWINKHLLQHLSHMKSTKLQEKCKNAINQITNYIDDNTNPLNMIRKLYTKLYTNFLPYFDEYQLIQHKIITDYDKLTTLIIPIGTLNQDEYRKRLQITIACNNSKIKTKISETCVEELNWTQTLVNQVNNNNNDKHLPPIELEYEIDCFFKNIKQINQAIDKNDTINTLQNDIVEFQNFCNEFVQNFNDVSLFVEMLPIVEYYAMKSMNSVSNYMLTKNYKLNPLFVGYDSITIAAQPIVHLNCPNGNEKYNLCINLWKKMYEFIESDYKNETFNGIEKILNNQFCNAFYRNFTSHQLKLLMNLQQFAMQSICLHSNICDLKKEEDDKMSKILMTYNGPTLTNSILSTIFNLNGKYRKYGLSELGLWEISLMQKSKVLWNNLEIMQSSFNIETSNLLTSQQCATKLLVEIQYLNRKLSSPSIDEHLNNLIETLDAKTLSAYEFTENLSTETMYKPLIRDKLHLHASLLNSLCGAVQLNLQIFLPLLDPVQKNRLKKEYCDQDYHHLNNLEDSYNFMKITMNYENLGEEILEPIRLKKERLTTRSQRLCEKVALRPNDCVWKELTKDVEHFLKTCCQPKVLYDLITCAEENILMNSDVNLINECLQQIDLWCNNAAHFQYHTLKKYSIFYRDFMSPIECAISMLKYGLTGLRYNLRKICESVKDIDSEDVDSILENLIEFPSVNGLYVLPPESIQVNVVKALEKLTNNTDNTYLSLVKLKLHEIVNQNVIAKNIDDMTFRQLDIILNIFNTFWKCQEELRRKKMLEDESLYVNKTRCEEEPEEETIAREIQSMFPNNVEDDFGEFVQENTLEQIKQNQVKTKSTKNPTHYLNDDDFKMIYEIFSVLMNHQHFDGKYANIEYIDQYKIKFKVFHDIFQRYKNCLNSAVDDNFYLGASLMVGISQHEYKLLKLNATANTNVTYNYYKDSNITEIRNLAKFLQTIEKRCNIELEQWPDHAVLNDIIRIISRIRSLPATSSLVRFNIGFQILRQKIDEWNKLAHKRNKFTEIEIQIAVYIQRWTKLELQCWRQCLSQSYERMSSRSYRYWFFIYNLLHEYLLPSANETNSTYIPCDLTDFRSVEKFFDTNNDDTLLEENNQQTISHLKSSAVIKVLQQFLESSTFAEFDVRMTMIKSFEQYLHNNINLSNSFGKRYNSLRLILYNLYMYYNQFRNEIVAKIQDIYQPIQKKLLGLVKIHSFNKDLSYWSMKSNIASAHRGLHKLQKEYETQLNVPISSVFIMRDTGSQQLSSIIADKINNKKDHKTDVTTKLYTLKVEHCLADGKLTEEFILPTNVNIDNFKYLPKVGQLFMTAIKITRQAISKSKYPNLINSLNVLLQDNIDTGDYLRRLEVDRAQERSKQKSQAKQIHGQKRKALSDLFKTLTTLGISFRTGLRECLLSKDLIDYKMQSFEITELTQSKPDQRIDQGILKFGDDINTFFSNCIFKLKLLQTVLLTPNNELGIPNLERIKGFAVDLFLLVQNQRTLLGKGVHNLSKLRNELQQIFELNDCLTVNDFDVDNKWKSFFARKQFVSAIKLKLCSIINVFEQYDLLWKCIPPADNDIDNSFSVLAERETLPQFEKIKFESNNILALAKKMLSEHINTYERVTFFNYQTIMKINTSFEQIISKIEHFCTDKLCNDKITSKALRNLLNQLKQSEDNNLTKSDQHTITIDENVISIELENIIHSVCLSMETLYKQSNISDDYDDEKTANENEDENHIFDNHLRIKIHLSLLDDINQLNVPKIEQKLYNILLSILYHNTNGADNAETMSVCQKICSILPLLQQYNLLCKFYLFQQISAHRVSTKMLSAMLSVFVELGAKGFCVPPDLLQDEDENEKQKNEEQQKSEGFGLEDGTGENDVSDKIESEDQLDSAKRPGDENKTDDKEDANCKEEQGIDMSEDFDSKLQDVEKRGEDSDDSDKSDNEDDEAEKQMGETEDGAEKLDEQIWGSDEENEDEPDDEEMNEEDNGKGSKEEDDAHNDLGNGKDTKQGDEQKEEGLDATDDNENRERKKKDKDIDQMEEPDVGEEQINPYHNELEEPPDAEDMNLGDNFNLDPEDGNENDENQENPFDIDAMKENMEICDEEDGDKDADDNEENDTDKKTENDNESDTDSDSEDDKFKPDEENPETNDTEENLNKEEDETIQTKGNDLDEKEETDDNDKSEEKSTENDYQPANDKPSEAENIQTMPMDENKGTSDQVQSEKSDEKDKQQKADDMDAQDTGEDQQGIGQAENEESKTGHQGIADTKETKSQEKRQKQNDKQQKREQGKTNEDRTLADDLLKDKKQLKTVPQLNEKKQPKTAEDDNEPPDENGIEDDDYQHVKEAKKTDRTTMDNATEEQSKKIQHEDDGITEEEENVNDKEIDDNMDVDEDDLDNLQQVDEMVCEDIDETHSNKKPKSKNDRSTKENVESHDNVEVDGEIVGTSTVSRGTDTTAHSQFDVLQDNNLPTEPTIMETLEMRKMYEKEMLTNRMTLATASDSEIWQTISNKMLPNARDLCEQLRLILEPTKCTRLKGDYRTGRRINMKKIIPYIASQFRKDKIWLRRTKPAQRDYRITIAIDDSKSMEHNNSKQLTLEAISLVSQALTLLESGTLSICSFGQHPQILHKPTEQFDGPRLVTSLTFAQNQSRIAELMDFIRTINSEDCSSSSSSDNGIFENLLLVLSDGRNIFSEGETKVKNAVKLARLQRIFIVYIIIDNPENKHSIIDICVPKFSNDSLLVSMKPYLDTFPFPYYVIVRDLGQLPLVLSDAMRQWFELVNSEQ